MPVSLDTLLDSKIAQHVVRELSGNEEIVALILFGSVARGQARQDSDIDLCIVTRMDISETDQDLLLCYGARGIDLSLFVKLPLHIRFRVIREGRVLFCNAPLIFHRIKIDTIRQYLDFAPRLRRYCSRAIEISGDVSGTGIQFPHPDPFLSYDAVETHEPHSP